MDAERRGKDALSFPEGCSHVDWLYNFKSTFPATAFPKDPNIPPFFAALDLATSHLSSVSPAQGWELRVLLAEPGKAQPRPAGHPQDLMEQGILVVTKEPSKSTFSQVCVL